MKYTVSYRPLRWFMVLGLIVSVHAAYGNPEIKQWLDTNNLLENHETLLVWTELVPATPGMYITGCRLAPVDGTPPFDVYFDDDGTLLEEENMLALGIAEKNWDDLDADIPTVVSFPDSHKQMRSAQPPFKSMAAPFVYTLEPVDHALLLEEDALYAETTSDSLVRYGINRDLEPSITFSGDTWPTGALHIEPDGAWQWEWQVHATGAEGVRLYFEELALPVGVEVYVYNPDAPSEYFGPYTSGYSGWTPSIVNEVAGIVCRGDSDANPDTVQIEVTKIIHVYRGSDFWEKSAGDCNIDTACHPAWEDYASAVGRLAFVRYDAWACTGSLITAPGYGTPPPFLLTANHCINSQEHANSLEVWWYYQKGTCGDVPPPVASSLPRSTGGATLLAGASAANGSDFTLLLLNEPPPEPTAFLGYTMHPLMPSEPVVCIHHPRGAEKRISFGVVSDTGSPRMSGKRLVSEEVFHEVVWFDGTTEKGSSGSPLLLGETGQIIGQLYGGYASCTAMTEPDYFGRMDITYQIIEPWLSKRHSIGGEVDTDEEGEEEGETVVEGEPENEEQETPPKEERNSFCGNIPASKNEATATAVHYAEMILNIFLPLSGLFLGRFFFSFKI